MTLLFWPQARFLVLLLGIALVVLAPAVTRGQAPEGSAATVRLELEETRPLNAPARAAGDSALAQRYPVRTTDGLEFAVFRRAETTATLELPGRRAVTLPSKLQLAISDNGKTIVQYGDELIQMHPVRTNLYWLNTEGTVSSRVLNRYNGQAVVDLSPDGYLAVAGAGYLETHGQSGELTEVRRSAAELETLVDLYSPEGKPIWETTLPPGRTVTQLRALPRGGGLLVNTAAAEDRLSDHVLEVIPLEGPTRRIEGGFGIIQKPVVVGDGRAIFIQGLEAYGLTSAESGELLWRRPGNIRMISPHGAAMDPDGKLVLVMTGTRKDRTQPDYDWTLTALDAESGETLGQLTLRRPYPSTWGQVFVEVRRDAAVVIAGDERLEIRLADLR